MHDIDHIAQHATAPTGAPLLPHARAVGLCITRQHARLTSDTCTPRPMPSMRAVGVRRPDTLCEESGQKAAEASWQLADVARFS